MSLTIGEIFDEYVDSLANLPSEVDQNMQELRNMDEEFQRQRDTYAKHKRTYLKALRNSQLNSIGEGASPTTPSPSSSSSPYPPPSAESRTRLSNEYKTAVEMQDRKIELAMRMYDLISRHIERIDSQLTQNNISITVDGQQQQHQNHHNQHQQRKRTQRSPSVGLEPTPSLFPARLPPRRSPHWDDLDGHRKRTLLHGTMGPRKRTHHSTRPDPSISTGALVEQDIDPNEPRYCFCNQVSFGDMVACDGDNCEKEWFHYACVGLTEPPVGKWFCESCSAERRIRR
ncbi:hypothetical protein [Absidia glauca]|uniref:Chromatin modification-related protein n=1 Tax=Absidia glauca TaxID=4829 RepID=A0A168R0Y5_ABSGL|nr:hypothetical protein [Absidia glauca]